MEPFSLRTERFLLDQPVASDVDDIAVYCTDPVFESFMVTPWPYERKHAVFFVDEFAPGGWERGVEWTWAIREDAGSPLLGVVGIRLGTGMVGYWLGAPHRGRGVMPEALAAVVDAVFERTDRDDVRWECVAGNQASMRVAQKVGFELTGSGTGTIPARDGTPIDAWTGILTRPAPARA
ncbi:GNAT family N-acetyltransferase [Microbacterium mangrovi]|uniref:GNAT family N-acetyltransferase n=1 Tax=Microbacterium mangrovi TaxID=1348253 RepID=UPI00068F5D69|nr:GNAT family N-acetyltransferase [Microbacterium mangrovi]